jgi:uncharacterized protein YggU (UPF0235/DUF167 family)
MKIFVQVKTNARQDLVEKIDSNEYLVKTKELPINGRANLAVIDLMAGYLNLPKSSVQIASGFGSKRKILEIAE